MSGLERAIGGEQVLLRVMEKLHEQIYSQDETIKLLMDKRLEQRKWIGLTNEEIKSLPSWWPSYEDAPALIELVKDVETKLREKNEIRNP